jgi:hypothetical protein
VLFTPLVAMFIFAMTLLLAGDGPAIQALLPSLAMLFLFIHAGHLFFAIKHFARRSN